MYTTLGLCGSGASHCRSESTPASPGTAPAAPAGWYVLPWSVERYSRLVGPARQRLSARIEPSPRIVWSASPDGQLVTSTFSGLPSVHDLPWLVEVHMFGPNVSTTVMPLAVRMLGSPWSVPVGSACVFQWKRVSPLLGRLPPSAWAVAPTRAAGIPAAPSAANDRRRR